MNDSIKKDLELWFRDRVHQAMKDTAERCRVMGMSDKDVMVLLAGEVMTLSVEMLGIASDMPPEKAGEWFAEGVRIIRRNREKLKEVN